MYTVILLWHVSGCGPLTLNEMKLPANVFKIHVLMLDVCWIV